jgi:hypothetical protein
MSKREALTWSGNYSPPEKINYEQQKEEQMNDRDNLSERKTQELKTELEQPELEPEQEPGGTTNGHMTYDLLNERVMKMIFHDAIIMVANDITKENFLMKPFHDLENYDLHNDTQFFVRQEIRDKLVKKMKIAFKTRFKETFKKELKANLEETLLETLRTKIV